MVRNPHASDTHNDKRKLVGQPSSNNLNVVVTQILSQLHDHICGLIIGTRCSFTGRPGVLNKACNRIKCGPTTAGVILHNALLKQSNSAPAGGGPSICLRDGTEGIAV